MSLPLKYQTRIYIVYSLYIFFIYLLNREEVNVIKTKSQAESENLEKKAEEDVSIAHTQFIIESRWKMHAPLWTLCDGCLFFLCSKNVCRHKLKEKKK